MLPADHVKETLAKSTQLQDESERRFAYKNYFTQIKSQVRELGEERLRRHYSVKHIVERKLVTQRDVEDDKSEMLRLNRNSYKKYMAHIERGTLSFSRA